MGGISMKVAMYKSQGAAKDVLLVGELDEVSPAAGQVKVKVHVSGINPSDAKSRAGLLRPGMPSEYIVPHSDGAGVIVEVGDGVPETRVGERVWIWNGQWMRNMGTAAEFVTLSADQAVKLPDNVGFDVGACLGIPALTAIRATEIANVTQGMTVLITGGAGAVGNYAIQIASQFGAKVITTVSSDEKASFAIAAGVETAINYRSEDVAGRIKELTDGAGVDAIIDVDVAANVELIPTCLKPHGKVVFYGYSNTAVTFPVQFMLQNTITIQSFLVYDLPANVREAGIQKLSKMLEDGLLNHTIAARFGLDDIIAAHEAVESGRLLGNVVIDI